MNNRPPVTAGGQFQTCKKTTMNKTTKYQLVELQIPAAGAAGQRFYFQDQPQLRSQSGRMIIIESIETFSDQAVPQSPLSNNPGPTVAQLTSAFLVLNIAGYEDLQLIPMAALNRVYADTGAGFVPFVHDLFTLADLYRVDWTKSYVQLAAAAGTAFAFLFGVRYRDNITTAAGNRL